MTMSTRAEVSPPMNGIRREAVRTEDMSTLGRLRILQQADGDIIVAVQSEENGLLQRGDSVEFCTIGAGGGRSPRTMAALIALMDAIDADNQGRASAGQPSSAAGTSASSRAAPTDNADLLLQACLAGSGVADYLLNNPITLFAEDIDAIIAAARWGYNLAGSSK